jgi:hypothetical protein
MGIRQDLAEAIDAHFLGWQTPYTRLVNGVDLG